MTSVEKFLAKNTFYCTPLKARITPAQCERNRKAPETGNLLGRHTMPFQCKACDWQAEQRKPKPRRARKMPTKEPQVCQGCGETKILLSRTLCHSCFQKQKKERNKLEETAKAKVAEAAIPMEPQPEIQVVPLSEHELTISFDQDQDLFEALSEEAHANYRKPESEVLSLLRTVFYDTDRVEKRPTAGA